MHESTINVEVRYNTSSATIIPVQCATTVRLSTRVFHHCSKYLYLIKDSTDATLHSHPGILLKVIY